MSQVLELLLQLLRCPSITPQDAGCQEIVAMRLERAGFRVESLRFGETSNLWATHGSDGPLVCFAGHTDVVPPGPLDAWTSPPFEPTIRDGFLHARGASDMKASDAAMVVALEQIAAEGHPGTIGLLLTSDEEGPGHDGTQRALRHLLDRGLQIDACLVGEPTSEQAFGDAIKQGRRGSITGRLVVSGVQGHTAYPHLATNAVHRLAPALAELARLDWGQGNESFPPTSCQIVHLDAGTGASNVIPGRAEVRWNLRFGTDHTVDSISSTIPALFQRHGITDPIAWECGALPFLTESGPLVDAIVAAVESETGLTPRGSTAGGTSDARFFAAAGIPVVEFGPINATIHAINESVEVACLEPLVRIYAGALRRFLGSGNA
ncbi:MAG: succinyl-diaminopimelate desuccinylase [Fimbriimonas sp.]